MCSSWQRKKNERHIQTRQNNTEWVNFIEKKEGKQKSCERKTKLLIWILTLVSHFEVKRAINAFFSLTNWNWPWWWHFESSNKFEIEWKWRIIESIIITIYNCKEKSIAKGNSQIERIYYLISAKIDLPMHLNSIFRICLGLLPVGSGLSPNHYKDETRQQSRHTRHQNKYIECELYFNVCAYVSHI